MVYLCSRYGDHANRLFQAVHFEAICKYHRINFYNLDFADMNAIYGIRKKYIWDYIKHIPSRFLPPKPIKIRIIYVISLVVNFIFCGRIRIINYEDDRRNISEKEMYDESLEIKMP